MNDRTLYRLTGWFGLAMVVLVLGQFPLNMQGDPSVSIYDGPALGLYVAAMVFATGLSQLIKRARPDYEWVGTLVFGAMAVWIGVTLVANGLEGAAALDTLGSQPDPSAVRDLIEGTLLIYNGAIAFAITGLFLGAAGYATFGTGVLPRWTGWVAYAGVILCIVSVPAIFGGPVDSTGFYNAGGWGPAIMANFPPALWFVSASLALLRQQATTASASTRGVEPPRLEGRSSHP